MPGAQTDHYVVLEVTRNATGEEIRASYRRLARQFHPDANPGPEAEARMRRINEAWEILRDPTRRSLYDRQLPSLAPRRAPARPVRRQPPPARPATRAQQDAASWFAEDSPRGKQPSGVEYTGDPSVDWYAAIGVPSDAPRAAIQKALARMAASLQGADISATEFARVRNTMRDAWAILGDQYMRAAYDRARKAHAAEASRATSSDSHGSDRKGGEPPESPGSTTPPPAPGYRTGPVTVNNLVVDKQADLRSADLRGADLRGLDLAGIDLRDARLQGADLEAASLRKANLAGADLSGANLRYADLANAVCQAACLRQADLTGAALHATSFYRANLAGASLSSAVGPGINLDYADLTRADFTGAMVTAQLIARGKTANTILPDGTIHP